MAKINSKNKGSRGERLIVDILNNRFKEYTFKRTPSSGAIFGGKNRKLAEGVDENITTALTSDIICPECFKFSIESKFYEEASFWDLFNDSSDLHRFMKQCENDANFAHKQPMLVVKYNRHNQIVFIKESLLNEPVFSHRGWNCYLFEDVLSEPDDFFFEE